jgi:hypothetical protein
MDLTLNCCFLPTSAISIRSCGVRPSFSIILLLATGTSTTLSSPSLNVILHAEKNRKIVHNPGLLKRRICTKKRLFRVQAVRQAWSESAQRPVYKWEALHSRRWTDGGPLLRFPGANWITWINAAKPISAQKPRVLASVTGLPL